MEQFTYSVSANNCNSPKITCEVKELTDKAARFLAENLSQAFRDVVVTCEQTGEIMYSVYYNDDFKKTTMTEVECLDVVMNVFGK